MRIRLLFRALPLLAVAIVSFPSHATTYAVGSGAGCTHGSLAAALSEAIADASPGPHLVKLLIGEQIVSDQEIDSPLQNLTLEGGYAACGDSVPSVDQRTVLRNTTSGARVLDIVHGLSGQRRIVILRRLTVTGGSHPPDGFGGGGIHVTGKLDLYLQDETIIENNAASDGGGIGMLTLTSDPLEFTRLRLQNESIIRNNQATGTGASGYGGGIDCFGGCQVFLWNGTIRGNTARLGGGGVALRSHLASLEINPLAGAQLVGLVDNSAGGETFDADQGFGGAIYSNRGMIDASLVGSGDDDGYSVHLIDNTANYGGAIYAIGTDSGPRTQISLLNAFAFGNSAKSRGGALYSVNGVEWLIDHDSIGDCDSIGEPAPCSFFAANSAQTVEAGTLGPVGGGVLYLTDDGGQAGTAQFFRTLFLGNHDLNGLAAVAVAESEGALRFQRSVFVDNGAGGPGSQRTLFRTAESAFEFYYNSVLDNDVDSSFFVNGGSLFPQGSVFWNLGSTIWLFVTGTMSMTTDCLVAHSTAGLPSSIASGAWTQPPRLDGRYAPRGGSSALDHCSDTVVPGPDLYGRTPMLDIASVPNRHGRNDLGAVEQDDLIHYGGFGNRPQN